MVERVTVAVDANGADLGPAEVARGAALAAERGIDVILFGPAAELSGAGVEVVDAGRADALVSGGSTGTALAASLFRFKRAPGVHRPALALVVPVPGST